MRCYVTDAWGIDGGQEGRTKWRKEDVCHLFAI